MHVSDMQHLLHVSNFVQSAVLRLSNTIYHDIDTTKLRSSLSHQIYTISILGCVSRDGDHLSRACNLNEDCSNSKKSFLIPFF